MRLYGLNQFGLNSDEAVYAGQAAGLAGFTQFAHLFGIFRAHPLLVQLVISVVFRAAGVHGLLARDVCVVFGVGLVLATGLAAGVISGRWAALIAMLFVALSPYAVAISRQVLLDGPEACFVGIYLVFLILYLQRMRAIWLWSAALAAGLAFLSKETAILLAPAFLISLMLTPKVPLRRRDLLIAGLIYLVAVVIYPLAELGAGRGGTGTDYIIWQLLRPPNHTLLFYFEVLGAIGWPLVAFAVVGAWVAIGRRTATDVALLTLTGVLLAFFELWPTKGYEYLMPLVPPLVLLAISGVTYCGSLASRHLGHPARLARWVTAPRATAALVVVVVGLLVGTAGPTLAADSAPGAVIIGTDSGQVTPARVSALAGSGGLLAGRPTAEWARKRTLPDSVFLTIGPSFANILEFYSLRRALALSVSPNPLHRNPAYAPVVNADQLIRSGAVQYLVYDAYSAARTSHFANRLLQLAHRFDGILVYRYVAAPHGRARQPSLVLVYQVRP
ncbi:MAG: ArnT family glycosyltransferase [Candidatus Dormibacteria bacterium]